MNFAAWKLYLPSPYVNHDYTQIASFMNLSSLESHRQLNDITFLFNLINNKIDSIQLLSKISWKIPQRGLRNTKVETFFIPHAKTNLYFHQPLWRMCRLANTTNIDITDKNVKQFSNTAREKFCTDFR